MNCLNTKCENEVTRDYPVCGLHESTAHFTNRADCRCGDCQAKRAVVDISGLNDAPRLVDVSQLAIRTLMDISQLKDDATYTKELAMEEVEALISECIEVLDAAGLIKAAIKHGDPKFIREGMNALADHTDSYWHRVVIGNGVGNIREHLQDLEDPICEAPEKAAA
jgi:hypothetical protein